jgi:hypothetical protein
MRLFGMIITALLLSSCGQKDSRSQGGTNDAIASDTCLSEAERQRLETPPVATEAARRLSAHWGICRSDVKMQKTWLAYLSAHGDTEARDELAQMEKLEREAPPIHAEPLKGGAPPPGSGQRRRLGE